MNLLPLVEAIERLSGPDREMDARIWLHVGEKMGGDWHIRARNPIRPSEIIQGRWMGSAMEKWPADIEQTAANYCVPRFTASMDAAMTLVPEGWCWTINTFAEPNESASAYLIADTNAMVRPERQYIATPALALAAVSLRARALSSMEKNEAERGEG